MAYVGIDLGTCYSCLSYIDETGNPVLIKDGWGNTSVPSVVHFPKGKPFAECEVGQVAKDSALVDPERTVQRFKPKMGVPNCVIKTIDGHAISPTQASAHVLRALATAYESKMGEKIEGAIITVPAHFGHAEREATGIAGEAAGLNVVQIVQEPVAAAIYYGACATRESKNVLVYDLGGGTFDVTVIKIRQVGGETNFEVVSMGGSHDLGGRLWDNRIIDYLKYEFSRMTGFAGEFSPYDNQILMQSAEDAKKRLSVSESTPITLVLSCGTARIELTRAVFEEDTSNFLALTIEFTRNVLNDAASKGCMADEILLVGGSTKMPQVERALRAEFPQIPLSKRVDPDEAVAKGAALSTLPWGKPSQSKPINVSLVTSKSYGTKVLDKRTGRFFIDNLILKNQRLDSGTGCCERKEAYATSAQNQTSVDISLYESDIAEQRIYDLDKTTLLVDGGLNTEFLNLPAGSRIEITFRIDNNGLLHVLGEEPGSRTKLEYDMQIAGLQRASDLKSFVVGDKSLL